MQLYEVALAEGVTSRDLMARARELGMGRLTATSELSADQVQRLCPGSIGRVAGAAPPGTATPPVVRVGSAGSPPVAPALTRPSPGPDATGRPDGPRMGMVAAVVLVALALVSIGIGILGGGSDEPEPRTASVDRTTEAAPEAQAPLAVVDRTALCAGWPVVAAYWQGFGDTLATATDVHAMARWAAETHRDAAVALRDDVGPAFDDASTEVQDVLRWVFDTAYPADDWDLDQVRIVTVAAAASVDALDRAATTYC